MIVQTNNYLFEQTVKTPFSDVISWAPYEATLRRIGSIRTESIDTLVFELRQQYIAIKGLLTYFLCVYMDRMSTPGNERDGEYGVVGLDFLFINGCNQIAVENVYMQIILAITEQ